MMYYLVKNLMAGNEKIYLYDEPSLKKGTIVVIPEQGLYFTAIVQKEVTRIEALTVEYEIEPILAVVDVTAYEEKLKSLERKLIITKKYEEKMKEFKMLDSMQKYAERDSEMKAMYDEMKSILS